MINVVCVKWGSKYGPRYVNILRDAVLRNLEHDHRFICYTDDITGIDEDIETRTLSDNALEGWYHKLWLFSEEAGLEDRVLYFDLDTVITGRLEDIADYSGEFCMLKDFYGWTEYGSGVMAWDADGLLPGMLWRRYVADGKPTDDKGDQGWLCDAFKQIHFVPEVWQERFPGQLVSYKIDARRWPPRDARVVCFHGNLNPSEYPSDWIKEVWKIGGLSETKLQSKCNVEKSDLIMSLRANLDLEIPHLERQEDHGRTMVIVGGAPSINDMAPQIRKAISRKADLFSVNGSHDWLMDRGMKPDYFALLDAREDNVKFVERSNKTTNYLIASHCSPLVFEELENRSSKVTMWHAYEPDLKEIFMEYSADGVPYVLLGGGNTVVLKLLYMGRYLGYRKFVLFGVDSSYDDDEHHAYDQTMNDGEFTLTVHVNDRTFKCAPWMLVQANDFQEQLRSLVDEGCEVTVSGRGLIPYIAQQLGGQYAERG